MISRTTANFRQQLAQLPKPVQRLARTAYLDSNLTGLGDLSGFVIEYRGWRG